MKITLASTSFVSNQKTANLCHLADRSCLLYQLAINYVADIQLNCKFARLDGYEGPKSFTCTLGKDFKKTPQIT